MRVQEMRERLRSEPIRHLTTSATPALFGLISNILAPGVLGLRGVDLILFFTVTFLFAMGMYGPIYLALSRFAWSGLEGEEFRIALDRTDNPNPGWLLRTFVVGTPTTWALNAGITALAAVTILIFTDREDAQGWFFAASLCAVLGAWILIVASSAMEYAREWARSGAFQFPGDDEDRRDLGDFFYLAIQVATTYSSSDVSCTNARARKLVSINSVAGFVFSTVILAFLVALVLDAA